MSDLTSFFVAKVFRYREKVIDENLKFAFPEKSTEEKWKIKAAFYRNFCDLFFETIKLLSIHPGVLKQRAKFVNAGLIPEMISKGNGGIGAFGHFNNWEWLGAAMGLHLPFETVGIYRPLSNSFFDRLLLEIREKTGNRMVKDEKAYRDCLIHLSKPSYYGFLSDQNPARTQELFFAPFMGKTGPLSSGDR